MNTHKLFGTLGALLLCAMVLVTSVAAIPVTIGRVEIDDHQISQNGANRLDIVRGEKVNFEITLEASQDVNDVEVQVFVSGFEHNSDMRLADYLGPFDMDSGITYRKSLDIAFPDLVDEDDYKVRVIVTDRNGDELVQNYNVKIDVERHELKIVDATFTPSRHVQAGQAVLAVVRVENFGEKDESDVKVVASIPELGVSATDYIDEIEYNDEEETEELYLKLPKCAKPGVYDMTLSVQYNDGFSKTGAEGQIEVLENPACAEEVVEVIQQPVPEVTAEPKTGAIRKALEVILLVLVALLVLIGLIVGFTKMGAQE